METGALDIALGDTNVFEIEDNIEMNEEEAKPELDVSLGEFEPRLMRIVLNENGGTK